MPKHSNVIRIRYRIQCFPFLKKPSIAKNVKKYYIRQKMRFLQLFPLQQHNLKSKNVLSTRTIIEQEGKIVIYHGEIHMYRGYAPRIQNIGNNRLHVKNGLNLSRKRAFCLLCQRHDESSVDMRHADGYFSNGISADAFHVRSCRSGSVYFIDIYDFQSFRYFILCLFSLTFQIIIYRFLFLF